MSKFSFNHYFNIHKTRIFIALGFIILLVILRYMGIGKHFTLENIKTHTQYIRGFIAQNYLFSVLIYITILTLASFLSIPITVMLNLVAGFFYGVFPGIIYVNIGTTLGGALCFLTFRYLLGGFVRQKYDQKLQKFNQDIEKNGYSYLLSLQLFPATPIILINIFGGLTSLKLWTFIWTTSVGILPGSLVYTFAGQQLSKLESIRDILSWPVLIVLILLALVSLIPVLYQKFFNNK